MLGMARKLALASFNIRFILFRAGMPHRARSAVRFVLPLGSQNAERRPSAPPERVSSRGIASRIGTSENREDPGSTNQFPTGGLFSAASKCNFRIFRTSPPISPPRAVIIYGGIATACTLERDATLCRAYRLIRIFNHARRKSASTRTSS